MRHYPPFLMRCEAAWRHHSLRQSKPPKIKKFRAHLADRRRILLGGSAQCPGLLSAKTMNQAGRYSAARARQSLRVAGRIPWASLAAKIHLCADEGGPFSVVEKPTECTHPRSTVTRSSAIFASSFRLSRQRFCFSALVIPTHILYWLRNYRLKPSGRRRHRHASCQILTMSNSPAGS